MQFAQILTAILVAGSSVFATSSPYDAPTTLLAVHARGTKTKTKTIPNPHLPSGIAACNQAGLKDEAQCNKIGRKTKAECDAQAHHMVKFCIGQIPKTITVAA